jgi:hypothetical protein
MKSTIKILILLLILGFSIPSKYYFDINKVKNKFPYKERIFYRISDTLSRKAKIDNEFFNEIFQFFTTPPPTESGECGCPIREQILPTPTYLLSYHGKLKQRYHDSINFDFITVLTEDNKSSKIYWLAYPDKNEQSDMPFIRKGLLSNMYLNPTLAEKYKTDTLNYESYSEFIDDIIIKKTAISNYIKENRIDSTIEILELCFYDMSVLLDVARFKNDSLILDFTDNELRAKYKY